MPFTAEVFSDWKGTLLPGDRCAMSVHPLSSDANQYVFAVFCTIFVTKYGNTIFLVQIRFF